MINFIHSAAVPDIDSSSTVTVQIENATSNIQASDANVPLTDARFEGKEDHNYGNEIHAPASMGKMNRSYKGEIKCNLFMKFYCFW